LSFTVFEITKAIRKRGFDEYHSTIRDIVHEKYDIDGWMPDYRRQSYDIGGGIFAIIYFHKDEDPQPYVDLIRQKASHVIQTNHTDLVEGLKDSVTAHKDSDFTTSAGDNIPQLVIKDVDHINRLRFTKPILEAAGFDAGDQISVLFKNGFVILNKPGDVGLDDLSSIHTIDKYTNLRLSLATVGYKARSYRIGVFGCSILAYPVTM